MNVWQNIRSINSSFALTSFRANYDNRLAQGAGVYSFRVNEMVYHMIKDINTQAATPSFAEIYIHDPD
jgi:hypothetical protein